MVQITSTAALVQTLVFALVIGIAPAAIAGGGVLDRRVLTRLLASPRERVRLQAVAAIDSVPRSKYDQLDVILDGVEVQIKRLGNKLTPPPSTTALLYTIGSTRRDDANEFLIELLDHENNEVVLLAVDVLGQERCAAAADKIAALIDHDAFDDFYAMRFEIVRALWLIRTPLSLDSLARIRETMDGQLAADIDDMFVEVTPADFDGDPQKFAAWKNHPSTDSSVRAVSFEYSASDAGGSITGNAIQFEAPQYYGIPIKAKRLLFVLDHSGSMREPVSSGTRLDRAKSELIYTIQSLPDDEEFSIMIFSNNVRMWRKELSIASRENKAQAIRFVMGIKYGDRTNTYGALNVALQLDPSLEAVYVLTDGEPTLGSIVDQDMIVQAVTHQNRFRHLRFHTIGVAVEGRTRTFLESLATHSNAEFREVN